MRERDSGRGPGSLLVVGLGPGDPSLLPPLAVRALERASAVVGYSRYLELVDQRFLAGRTVVSTGMRGEVDRCSRAVDLALEGDDVAVVSSGDAGIYAMAGLVCEMLDQRGLADRIPLEVVPGIPAFVAAAALLGAPLTHDFASVSLSDLLTPWEAIETRLRCAAEGDFVTALYNPRSKKRDWQLGRALEIFRKFRDGRTPVGVASRAYRPGQSVAVSTLEDVELSTVDMQSLVLIGNSSTRFFSGARGPGMYTPRGYAGKYRLMDAD